MPKGIDMDRIRVQKDADNTGETGGDGKTVDKPEQAEDHSEEKKPEEMSEEEIERTSEQFLNRLFPSAGPVKKVRVGKEKAAIEHEEPEDAEEEEEPEAEEEDKEKEEEEEGDGKEPDKGDEKKKKATPPPPLSDFTKDRAPRQTDTKPAPQQEDRRLPDLSAKEKKFLGVLAQMGKMWPEKYRNIVNDHLAYLQKESAYIQKWIDEHPDEDFDAKAEEHERWYARNEPKFDEDEYEEASEALMEERVSRRLEARQGKTTKKLENDAKLKEAEPKIAATTYASVVSMVENTDEELAKHIVKQGGQKLITADAQQAMEEDDPLALEIVMDEAEPLTLLVTELEKLALLPEDYKLDMDATVRLTRQGRSFQTHRELIGFMNEYEQAQLSLPPEDTMRDGKRLVGSDVYNSEYARIMADKTLSNEEKRRIFAEINSQYYTLSIDDYRSGLVDSHASRASATIKKMRKLASSKKPKAKETDEGEKEERESRKEEQAEEDRHAARRKQRPSISSKSDKTDTGKTAAKDTSEVSEEIVDRVFGRVG